MKKLREEHDAVFDSDHEKTVAILHENPYKVNELEYTTAVIKETLRLFPVGFEIRQTNDQYVRPYFPSPFYKKKKKAHKKK